MTAAAEKACDNCGKTGHYGGGQEWDSQQCQCNKKRNELFVAQPDVYERRKHKGYPARTRVGHDKRNCGEYKTYEERNAAKLILSGAGESRTQGHKQHEKLRIIVRIVKR